MKKSSAIIAIIITILVLAVIGLSISIVYVHNSKENDTSSSKKVSEKADKNETKNKIDKEDIEEEKEEKKENKETVKKNKERTPEIIAEELASILDGSDEECLEYLLEVTDFKAYKYYRSPGETVDFDVVTDYASYRDAAKKIFLKEYNAMTDEDEKEEKQWFKDHYDELYYSTEKLDLFVYKKSDLHECKVFPEFDEIIVTYKGNNDEEQNYHLLFYKNKLVNIEWADEIEELETKMDNFFASH